MNLLRIIETFYEIMFIIGVFVLIFFYKKLCNFLEYQKTFLSGYFNTVNIKNTEKIENSKVVNCQYANIKIDNMDYNVLAKAIINVIAERTIIAKSDKKNAE